MSKRNIQRCHNMADLRRLAKKRLPGPIFHYMDGGSDDELTLRNSTSAFDKYELMPRMLVDVDKIDMSTTVFGQKISWPVFAAPTGASRLFHHEGEMAVARAVKRLDTMYSLSTLATYSIEDVADIFPGPKMFQIYVQKDRGPVKDMIARCKEAGYAAMCLTVDVPVAGNRERDFYWGMNIPPQLTLMGFLDVAMHPGWVWKYLTTPKFRMANLQHIAGQSDDPSSLGKYVATMFDRAVTWKDAEWMAAEWGGPFAIKGVLTVDDCRRAVDHGATAVMVSNHGGRQLDSVPAPIDMIGDIADAVGDKLEIICEGGIRRGKHVLMALARGATACSVGRGYLYGLGAGGEEGVYRSLSLLRDEVERGMALLGTRNVGEVTGQYIRRAP